MRAARLWVVGALRRPTRAIAIVGALAVMALTTIGALVGGDALDRLFIADAEAEWGAVDVEVTADENSVMEESTGRLLGVEAGAAVTAFAPRLLLPATASGDDGRVPGVLLMGLGAEEQTFPELTAVEGQGNHLLLQPGEVIVNQRLAGRLGLGAGDRVTLVAAVPRWEDDPPGPVESVLVAATTVRLELEVAGVVRDIGVADLHRTPNALVRRDVLQRLAGLEGQVTVTHLQAALPAQPGADAVLDAIAPLTRALGLDADAVKADEVALADEDGGLFRSILLTLALLVIVAAAVATVGLLVALGEERARELAQLRVAGLRRRAAGRLLIAESTVYGIAGAALGALAGVPFGNALARAIADHFANLSAGRGREQVALVLDADPSLIVTGALVVAVVAALAGRSASRLVLAAELDELLRGEPTRLRGAPRGSVRPALGLAAGAFLLGAGATSGGALVFIGLTVLLAAWWLWARRRAAGDRDRTDRRAAWIGLGWALLGAAALGDFSQGVQAGFGVLTVAGITAILCATVLVSGRLRSVMRFVRSYVATGAPQAALRTAGAYAEEARRRSATTIATVGCVLFMVAALAVLGTAQALDARRQSGGFDVVASTVTDVEPLRLGRLDGVADVASVPDARLPQDAYAVVAADGRAATVPYPVRLAGATSDLVARQGFGLAQSLPAYPTAQAALDAVVADRDKAVVDRAAAPEGARVGDRVVIDLGPSPRSFTLIAILDTYLLSTAFVSEAEFGELVDFRGRTLVLARAAEGTTPEQLATALEEAGSEAGLTADTVEELRGDVVAVNRTFTDVFAVMLVLGLAVAVASIAAYLTRAARERRAALAVLRALGLRRRSVVLSLAAEPVLAGAVGTALGLGVGLAILRVLFAVGFSDLAFLVDWTRIGVIAGGTLVALAAVCLGVATVTAPRDVAAGLRDLG